MTWQDDWHYRRVGSGLARPECVLATAGGDLFTSDGRGGVAHLAADGTLIALYTGRTDDLPEGLRPNGIALEPDGSFLVAQLGAESGGVWRLDRSGQVRPVLTAVDGLDLPPSNFVLRDGSGRLWITVSSRLKPRTLDFHAGARSGFVVLVDRSGARIVADGLGFTNECALDPAGRFLYVVETYGRRLGRFALAEDGAGLGTREVVAEFGPGQFPDGLAFDAEGRIWIAGIVSNQLLRVDPASGEVTVMLEDGDSAHVAEVEAAYAAGRLERSLLDRPDTATLRHISSVAFGGPDLRTGYLGCLLGDCVTAVAMPVAGHPPPHWHYATRAAA